MNTLLLLAALTVADVPTEAQLLHGIRGVESSFGRDTRDGERHLGYCERSVGPYQIRVPTLRWMVETGRLPAPAGYSLTNCTGIRAYLRTERGGREAARVYLRYLRERFGDVERALAAWNCGPEREALPVCLRYAGAVLAIASEE